MIYGYIRVSTKMQASDGNSLESQEATLRDQGVNVIYSDECSGKLVNRPKLNQLLTVIRPGDTLVVSKLDRLSRSAVGGVTLIKLLISKGIAVRVVNMGFIDNSITGQLIITVMFAFAEFERESIIERTREGKIIAKSKDGFVEGRPPKYKQMVLESAVAKLSINGGEYSYKNLSSATGISMSTLKRYQNSKLAEKV